MGKTSHLVTEMKMTRRVGRDESWSQSRLMIHQTRAAGSMSRAMVELNSTSATAKTRIKGAMAGSWQIKGLPPKQTASRPSRRRRYVLSYHLQLHDAHLYPQILTPADFALINDLRLRAATKAVESGGCPAAKRKLASLEAAKKAASSSGAGGDTPTLIPETDVLGPREKVMAGYEERVASIARGREGRENFGSLKGKHRKETPSSSTNREKARNRPIMMIIGSKGVSIKKKQSLREKQKRLRAYIDKAKKVYH